MHNLNPTITISPDGMQAILNLSPARTTAEMEVAKQTLTAQLIETALNNAGVRIPPAEGSLEKLVEAYRIGKDISGSVLVYGKPPRSALPGELSPFGDLNYPVFPGDTFGRAIPARPPKNGINVLGEIIPPLDANQKVEHLTPASSESVVKKDGKLVAMRYGLVAVENNEIRVIPLLQISKDLMTLNATIYPKDFCGREITRERMLVAVKALGLKARVNEVLLETGLEKAIKTAAPVFDVPLCNGIRPFKGEDGWLEILIVQKQERIAGIVDRGGNIDYKQRGAIETVKKGDIIARIHPPGRGRPGRNLLGDIVEPEEGIPYFAHLGENVIQEGREIIATSGGLLIHRENEIVVSEVYLVSGDVSLHTGHISLDRGSVQVEGSVLTGFHVSCPSNILVKGTVEDSILTAGGDIDIDGGIMMNNTGLIRAGGSVRALFGIATNIHAGLNVYIMNEINKSKVIAEGSIIVAGGQGKVIGGFLHCGKEIQATQVGSELAVPTHIRLGIDQNFLEEYKAEQARLGHSLKHIQQKLGNGSDNEVMRRYPKNKTSTVLHILTVRRQLQNRISELVTTIARLERQLRQESSPVLKVHGIIYPGTVIQCGTEEMTIHSPLSQGKISFDFENRQFKVSSL